jgi:hypothetical protein
LLLDEDSEELLVAMPELLDVPLLLPPPPLDELPLDEDIPATMPPFWSPPSSLLSEQERGSVMASPRVAANIV